MNQLRKILRNLEIDTRLYKESKSDMRKVVVYGIPDIIKFKRSIKPKFKRINIAEAQR